MELGDLIIYAASVVTAIITIGGALLWLYKKLVIEPAQKNDKEMYAKVNEELRKTIEPLNRSIESLNRYLEESKKDRQQLNDRVDEHGDVLTDHETRITILEFKKGRS